MEQVRSGVWRGTYRGREYTVTRLRGPDWSPGVPRAPRFYYSTCGLVCDAVFLSRHDAESAAIVIIIHALRRERHQRARAWYRGRFSESMEDTAAVRTRDELRPRLWEIMDLECDPGATHADRVNATEARRLLLDLMLGAWFHEIFDETLEEAEAETAPLDRKAEKIGKLEALRDHPATPRDEVAAAERAIARLRGRADDEDAAA